MPKIQVIALTSFQEGEMVQEAVPVRVHSSGPELLVMSLNNPGISARLSSNIGTTRTHVSNIFAKLGVSNRAEAITLALRNKPVQ